MTTASNTPAPLMRECPLCGGPHEVGEYTVQCVAAALAILDDLEMEDQLRPVAELLGLVLRKVGACPLCGHMAADDPAELASGDAWEPESWSCTCECHAEDES
jgi:hypothetical protein